MKNYSKYWKLFNKNLGEYSKIRLDEKEFINKTIYELHNKSNLKKLILTDVGCGDGRISSYITSIMQFERVILIDSSDSVHIAKQRLLEKCKSVDIFECNFMKLSNLYDKNSLLVCVGFINYFKDQNRALEKLLELKPKFIYFAVTGYGPKGKIYKLLNIIRGKPTDKIIETILDFLIFSEMVQSKIGKNIFTYILKLIEPLVSSKIYFLKSRDYENFFLKKNYILIKSAELGLCKWMCFSLEEENVKSL
jgi:ubiquinone/menaquinone biosynthesis C-methylase UbiE